MQKNLLSETIEALNEHSKTFDDVLFIVGGGFEIDRNSFLSCASRTNYDPGFGSQEIPSDLKIVGDDWWLERSEYDGSEWWSFRTKPKLPNEERILKKINTEYDHTGDGYVWELESNENQGHEEKQDKVEDEKWKDDPVLKMFRKHFGWVDYDSSTMEYNLYNIGLDKHVERARREISLCRENHLMLLDTASKELQGLLIHLLIRIGSKESLKLAYDFAELLMFNFEDEMRKNDSLLKRVLDYMEKAADMLQMMTDLN